MKGNVIVGQSGGPTSVINSSLAGVFKTAKDGGAKVYGMLNGIQGLLEERYIDISEHIKTPIEIEILRRTPSAYLGSCRYKLPKVEDSRETYEKLFAILKKLEIEYFFYIGGNDSMDTTYMLSQYAKKIGSDIKFMGVPKTIDNDLEVTDHTPGFGSAAKYIATSVKELIRDNKVNDMDIVSVVEIMGRDAGWLTGAAALSKGADCPGPDYIYLPEIDFDIDNFLQDIRKAQADHRSVVVCVSEGVRTKNGTYVCEAAAVNRSVDAFGHKQLTGTARALADLIGEKIGCKVRAIEFSSLQRCAAHLSSETDNNEAFNCGAEAVSAAFKGETGKVAIMVRKNNSPYDIDYDIVDVARVANLKKDVPRNWINAEGNNVTDEFVEYVRPLIMGEMSMIYDSGLPTHLPYVTN